MQGAIMRCAGSTDTSLWTHYNAGEREYCGNKLPDDMRKNDKLEEAIITPTTKAADHDVPISPQAILSQGILSQQDWHQASVPAQALIVHLDCGTDSSHTRQGLTRHELRFPCLASSWYRKEVSAGHCYTYPTMFLSLAACGHDA